LASAAKVEILEAMKSTVMTSSPDVMGGTPVFVGTRVPIENLLDYLEGGESIDDFLEGFPSVSREQVITFLEEKPLLPTERREPDNRRRRVESAIGEPSASS
jgi:uncharacterized protein (DUF433 family)